MNGVGEVDDRRAGAGRRVVDAAESGRNVSGIAITAFLFVVGVLAAAWSLDDHFISRREFDARMSAVTAQLDRIERALHHSGGTRADVEP